MVAVVTAFNNININTFLYIQGWHVFEKICSSRYSSKHTGVGTYMEGYGEVRFIDVLANPVGCVFQRCVITVSIEIAVTSNLFLVCALHFRVGE